MAFLPTLFFVFMAAALAQSKVKVGSVERVRGIDTLQVKKGENLTITCRSDLVFLTLEFTSVVYNNTKNENGTYTVTYIKTAEKSDNNQTALCRATNSTGYQFEAKATVLLKVSTNATITGIEDLAEDENATLTCTITSTSYPPSLVGFLYASIFSNPVVDAILRNSSLYNTTEVYDNNTDIYTTTVVAAPIPVTRSLNDQAFVCYGIVNTFQFFKGEKVIVSYGPREGNLNFWSSTGGMEEGRSATLTCSVTYSNPASTLTWYNNTTKFTPSTPAVVTKEGGTHYKTNQVWTFTYQRDQSGSNITCVATGYRNKTVSKTLQIGDIKYSADLVIRGKAIVDEGGTLNLTCEVVSANPMTNGSWSGIGSGLLVISNISKTKNQQEYRCSATNSVGTSNRDIRISVQYGPDFTIASNVFGSEGSNLTISAVVSANPAPSNLTWRKAGNDTVLSTGSSNLVLYRITKENEGLYVLEATSIRLRENNVTEQFTRNASVNVTIGYGPKDSVRLLPNITVLELNAGSPVPTIRCSADCYPSCDFKWTRYYRKTATIISTSSILDLGNASSRGAGIHTCEGYNLLSGKKHAATATFELRVKYAPEIYSIEINNPTKKPFDEKVPITVKAIIRSNPVPSNITFGILNVISKFSTFILDSRYSVNLTSSECSYDCESQWDLILSPPSCTDTGNTYLVYAKNTIGFSPVHSTPESLYVTCSPRLSKDHVTKRVYSVCEGNPLNMSVTLVSVPGPLIVWRKSNVRSLNAFPQNTGGSNTGNTSVFYTSRYNVPDVTWYRFGTYLFEASNTLGGPKLEFTIQVVRGSSCSGISTDFSTVSPDPVTTMRRNVASTRTTCIESMCFLELVLFIVTVLVWS